MEIVIKEKDREIEELKEKIRKIGDEMTIWIESVNDLRKTQTEKDIIISQKEELINKLIIEKQDETGKLGEEIHKLEHELAIQLEMISTVKPKLKENDSLKEKVSALKDLLETVTKEKTSAEARLAIEKGINEQNLTDYANVDKQVSFFFKKKASRFVC